MKEWGLYDGIAGPLPYSPQSQIETLPEEDYYINTLWLYDIEDHRISYHTEIRFGKRK